MKNNDPRSEIQRAKQALSKLGITWPIKSCRPLNGISNDNFLIDERYVLRIPYRRQQSVSEFPYEMEEIAFRHRLGPKPISHNLSTGIKLTRYLTDHSSLPFDKYDDNMLHRLAEGVETIHNFRPVNKQYLDYYGDIKRRLKFSRKVTLYIPEKDYFSFLDKFRSSYERLMEDACPSHLDLVASNILIGEAVKFIDFEYSAYAFRDFDLVSLLSENEMTTATKERLIGAFFPTKSAREKFCALDYPLLQKALDLYWFFWALEMRTGEEQRDHVFEAIALQKAQRFLSL